MKNFNASFSFILFIIIVAIIGGHTNPAVEASETRATTRYVSLSGTNNPTCTPSSNACATIAHAKSRSFAGDIILVGRSALDFNGVFNQSATIDFPLTIEGRFITAFPTVAWTTCSGTACPTITPPAGQSALLIQPDSGETVTVNNLNFVGSAGAPAVQVEGGKAVFNGCSFSSNINSSGSGGAMRVIFNSEVDITDCEFEGNIGANGGAISAQGIVSVDDAMFKLNLASNGFGGAIDSSDTFNANGLAITNSQFERNSATRSGGAVRFVSEPLSISNSDFISNTAGFNGGALSISGDASGDSATVSNGLFQGNRAESDDAPFGAAIELRFGPATLTNLTVQDNSIEHVTDTPADREFDWGGAIAVRDRGDLTLKSSTIADNVTEGVGGAGAIAVRDSTLRVEDSTITNHASTAVYAVGDTQRSVLTFVRSTVSYNLRGIQLNRGAELTAANSTFFSGGQNGSPIFALNDTDVSLQYATVVRDTGGLALAADIGTWTGTYDIKNSIVSGTCSDVTMNWDSRSIYDDGTCDGSPGSFESDVGLGPLADYGGPTMTMYPTFNSPAIDQGLQSDCLGTLVGRMDQRGEDRPFGAACDLGAVEYDGTIPLAVGLLYSSVSTGQDVVVGFVLLLVWTGGAISAEIIRRRRHNAA